MSLFGWLFGHKKATTFDPRARVLTASLDQQAQETRRYLAGTDYLLPKDAEEEYRLNYQHYALYHALGNHYLAPLSSPIRLMLDTGTGTGIWPIEMARLFPEATVIGIDIDAALFKQETPEHCLLRVGNVLTGLPFPDRFFEYTHQRLLVAAIPAGKWPEVIRELVRVTRVGGWVEVVEVETRIANAGPATVQFQTLLDTLIDGEPIRHLGDLLTQAGLEAVETQCIPLALGEWGGRVGALMKRDVLAVAQAFQGKCCQKGSISPETFDHIVSEMAEEWECLHAACMFYAVYGRRTMP
jgi:SAM-dependent methyltransferase